MFDIGFWELIVIAVLAIIIVGPEKLPTLARNVIVQYRKMKRFFHEVKDDFERELDVDDLKRLGKNSEIGQSFEDFNQSIQEVREKAREIGNHVTDDIHDELEDIELYDYDLQEKNIPISQLSSKKRAKLSGISSDIVDDKERGNSSWENDALTYESTGVETDKSRVHK